MQKYLKLSLLVGIESGDMMVGFDGKKDMKILEKNLKVSFDKIREEFEDHLDSINENTNEIQTNYEYVYAIDAKMDKLSERLDELQYMVECAISGEKLQRPKSEGISLSHPEQEIFLALYTLPERQTLTFVDICRKTNISPKIIKTHVSSLISKGIPVRRVIAESAERLFLDEEFKHFQAKSNLVQIDESIARTLQV